MYNNCMNIPDSVAIVIYDMAHSMKRPLNPMEVGRNFRRAYWIADELDAIFEVEGIDPTLIERPEVPAIPIDYGGEEMEDIDHGG
jgi:hypothetical protein